MAKHEFVPVRESDRSVNSGQCIRCGIIVRYVNGVLPEKVLEQDCQRWDSPSTKSNSARANKPS
jgi:hypothetical protein